MGLRSVPNRSRSVLIVGGGTFGISAAYHLAERGYHDITVLDRCIQPSPESAGNDINKIVRSDYSDALYTQLAEEAMAVWKDDSGIFHDFFHATGWLIAAANISIPFLEKSLANAEALGVSAGYISEEDVRARWPALSGSFENWRILWNPSAGWVDAVDAQMAMVSACRRNGVRFISGEAGHVERLLFDEGSSQCLGALSTDGSVHEAAIIILAAGAAAAEVLDMEGQLVAKGHSVGFLQLTPEEAEKYKNIPVFDNLEQGLCFPPNKDGIMKLATVEWFTNSRNSKIPGVSLPRYRSDHQEDEEGCDIPEAYAAKIRMFLNSLLPELADRPWSQTKICWDAETADLDFLIAPHPTHKNLKLAVGGSAHGFKFLPTIGGFIADMIEDGLRDDLAKRWRWRPGVVTEDKGPKPHPFEPEDLSQSLPTGV